MKSILIFIIILFYYPIIYGDTIYLKNGSSLDGKIIETHINKDKVGGYVVFFFEGVTTSFNLKEIDSIKYDNESESLLKYEGKWLTYDQVQEAKGYVKYNNKWITPEARYELEQKAKGLIKYEGKWMTYDQEQEAKGLVKYQDKWVTPDEKYELEQKAKGLIKYEGKWMTYEQIQEAKGLVKYNGVWMAPRERRERKWKNALLNIREFAVYIAKPLLAIIFGGFFILFIVYLRKKHIINKLQELFRFVYHDLRSRCSVVWLFFIMLFIILFIIYIIQGFINGFESPEQYPTRCRDCGARTYGGDMFCGQCLKAEGERMEMRERLEYLREHRR